MKAARIGRILMHFLAAATILALAAAAQAPIPGSAPARAAQAAQTTQTALEERRADAWHYLVRQLDLGPRTPGSPGHRLVRELIVEELSECADEVRVDEFVTTYDGHQYPMANISAMFRSRDGRSEPFVILAAHFDTRPAAECDPDPARRSSPVPGANDGASGTAVLLEVAGILAQERPPVPVMLVFFDGEDFGPSQQWMFLGSRRFAQRLDTSSVLCMILLDMVGDADLDIYVEGNSFMSCPELVEAVWASAAQLGWGDVFRPDVRHYILDDHIPFIEKGIPSLDIIDFDYAYWHTTLDTADKCSPDSLRIVRDVVLDAVFRGGLVSACKR